MLGHRLRQAFLSIFAWLLASGWLQADETIYIERESEWALLPGLEEASDPMAAWRSPAFDDASWERSPAPFGYGDPPYGTDLSDAEPPMRL